MPTTTPHTTTHQQVAAIMAEEAAAAVGLSGGQMACTMLFGSIILTYLGLEASRLRVLLRVGALEEPGPALPPPACPSPQQSGCNQFTPNDP